MSINIEEVTNLTEQLSQGTKQLAKGSEEARLKLMQVAQKLAQVLQTPQETFLRLWMFDVSMKSGKKNNNEIDIFFRVSRGPYCKLLPI